MTAPTVTVVIPVRDDEVRLARALRSLAAQTDAADEVIVVDDASQPAVERGHLPEVRGLRVMRREVSEGVGPARNLGIRQATSDYVAFLDADDEFLPERLAGLRRALLRHPEWEVAYSDAWVVGRQGRRLRLQGTPEPEGDLVEKLLARPFLTTSTMVVRRTRLLASGGFPPREVASTFEDYVLWLELARVARWGKLAESQVLYHLDTPVWTKRRAPLGDWHAGLMRAMLQAAGEDPGLRRLARSTASYMAAKRALQEGRQAACLSFLHPVLATGRGLPRAVVLALLAVVDALVAGRLLSSAAVRARVFWDYA